MKLYLLESINFDGGFFTSTLDIGVVAVDINSDNVKFKTSIKLPSNLMKTFDIKEYEPYNNEYVTGYYFEITPDRLVQIQP